MTIQRISWDYLTERSFYRYIDGSSNDFNEEDYDDIVFGLALFIYGSEILMDKCEKKLPLILIDIKREEGCRRIYDEWMGSLCFPIFFASLSQDERKLVETAVRDIRNEVDKMM